MTSGQIDWSIFQDSENFTHSLTDSKGRVIDVPLRRGLKDGALIDYLTFTFHLDSVIEYYKQRIIGDNEMIQAASSLLNDIFGFGISHQLPGKGKFFYQSYYHLGPTDAAYGTFHFGGQRDTMLVDLNAVGCQASKKDWELRLYLFLSDAIKPRITRCDVAHDFFNGEYTPDRGLSDHAKGLFDRHNVRPKIECRGTAWHDEDHTGKTLYIGRRSSSQLCRIYEKGKKLGDKSSNWVRFEVEFRKHDCVIPLDILIYPGQYLGGAFPIGEQIFTSAASRIETSTKIVNLNFEQREFHARNQVGRMVRFYVDLGLPDSEIVKRLCGEEGKYPKGLNPAEYDCEAIKSYYLHDRGFEPLSLDEYRLVDDLIPSDLDMQLRIQRQIDLENEFKRKLESADYPCRYPQLKKGNDHEF